MVICNELSIVIIALLIVVGVCLGLLIALVVFTLGRRTSPPPPVSDVSSPPNQAKRIANCTMAMTAGLVAIVFAAELVPIETNPLYAAISLIGGLAVVIGSWIWFRRI